MKLRYLLCAAIAALLIVPAASAKKPSHAAALAAPASITLDQPSPAFGDHVTFTYDTGGAPATRFWVHLVVVQGGRVVQDQYSNDALSDPSGSGASPLNLGPTAWWTEGAADATATLLYFDCDNLCGEVDIATTAFTISG